jgi:hypothetical protein
MAERWVLVRHTKGRLKGREYGVRLADYAKRKLVEQDGELMTYEEAGAVIVSNLDGSRYDPPEKADKAADKPAEKAKE